MLNLFQKRDTIVSNETLLQKLDRQYSRKIMDVIVRKIGKIDSAPEMAYFQLTKGGLSIFRTKALTESIIYFSKIKNYVLNGVVYFKDLTEMWTPSANHSTGRIDVEKIQFDLENKSATLIFLKVLFELKKEPFQFVSKDFKKLGFKFPSV